MLMLSSQTPKNGSTMFSPISGMGNTFLSGGHVTSKSNHRKRSAYHKQLRNAQFQSVSLNSEFSKVDSRGLVNPYTYKFSDTFCKRSQHPIIILHCSESKWTNLWTKRALKWMGLWLVHLIKGWVLKNHLRLNFKTSINFSATLFKLKKSKIHQLCLKNKIRELRHSRLKLSHLNLILAKHNTPTQKC